MSNILIILFIIFIYAGIEKICNKIDEAKNMTEKVFIQLYKMGKEWED